MSWSKRLFDVIFALIAIAVLAIPAILIGLLLLVCQGRPIFYLSERMQSVDRAFQLFKFRTMHDAPADMGVSGGDKAGRITKIGNILRRWRLDELPQVWNVLCGHISFVGPRPPLRQYVMQFPDVYAKVLQCRPGLTGLATLAFHHREETLLAACTTPAETETVYTRRCLLQKARLDLIYQNKQCLLLDATILLQTVLQMFKKRRLP